MSDKAHASGNHEATRSEKLRVCFVLSYRDNDYIRGRNLCEALSRMPFVELEFAVNRSRGIIRYWQTLVRLLQVKRRFKPDLYVLGFRGHEIAWLVRWLTRKSTLWIDVMMSPYAALREERKLGWLGRLAAPLWRQYETRVLRSAELLLADTALHSSYYQRTFALPIEKLVCVPVGAIEPATTFVPSITPSSDTEFRVLFYGSFLPLHGVNMIVEAAAQLAALPIHFRFVGGTRAQANWLRAQALKHGISRFSHERWVPREQLLEVEILQAGLCLGGPFGGTPQARRVVTGKAMQCLALGKATVVGRVDADYGFMDRVNCLLVEQNDANALAAAIRWAFSNQDQLRGMGTGAKRLYCAQFSIRQIVERLTPAVQALARRSR